MLKKCFIYMVMATALAFASACGGGGDDPEPVVTPPAPNPGPDNPTPPPTPSTPTDSTSTSKSRGFVSFFANLEAMTRATETQFQNGDRISVFAMKAAAGDNRAVLAESGNYADNVAYTYDGSKFTATKGIELFTDTKYFYIGVYPYDAKTANAYSFEVQTDQSTASALTASDLCTASTGPTDALDVELKFSHRLAKLVITLTGEGWTENDFSMKLNNVMTIVSVNLNNLTFVGTGAKKEIACLADGSRSFTVILPPQIVQQGELFMTVVMNGKVYPYTTDKEWEFRSGMVYALSANLDKGKEILQLTGDINPWKTGEEEGE